MQNGIVYEDNSVMEKEVFEKMLEITDGVKIIPTMLIDGQLVTGFDRNKLKDVLGAK